MAQDIVQQAKVAVLLDGTDANTKMKELTSNVDKYTDALLRAYKAGDKDAMKQAVSDLKAAEKNIESFKKQSFDVDKVLKNLSGSSIKDLKKAIKELNTQLEGQARGTNAYKETERNIKAVQTELDAARGKAQQSGFSFKRMWEMAGGVGLAQLASKALGWIKDGVMNLINSSETLKDRFEFTMAGMGGALDAFKQSFIDGLEDMTEGIEDINMKTTHWYSSALAGVKAFGVGVWETVKLVGKSAVGMASLDDMKKALDDIAGTYTENKDKMNAAANAAMMYAITLDNLQDAENKLIAPRSKALMLLNQARTLANDESLSIQERTKYLQQSIDMEEKATNESLANQDIKVKALRQLKQSYLDNGLASQWTADKEKQLQTEEAKIFEIQTQSYSNKRRAENSLRNLEEKAAKDKEKAHKEEMERIEKEQKKRQQLVENIEELNRQYELSQKNEHDKGIQLIEDKYAKEIKAAEGHADIIKGLTELKNNEIAAYEKDWTDKQNKEKEEQLKEFEKRKLELQKEYSLLSAEELQQLEIDELHAAYDEKLLSEEEFQLAKQAILDKYKQLQDEKDEEARAKALEALYNNIAQAQAIAENFSKTTTGIRDAETTALETNNKKQIADIDKREKEELAMAGNNEKAKSAIEKKYTAEREKVNADFEEQKSKVIKKYATIEFNLKVATIGADTYVAAQKAYTAMAGIPPAPLWGVIAAAAATAAGVAQLAGAKAEKDKAMAGFFDGGFTGNVPDNQPAGIVHGNEYVIPAWQRRTPYVMAIEPILEAQRKSRRGYADGGAVASPAQTTPLPLAIQSDPELKQLLAANLAIMSMLQKGGINMIIGDKHVEAITERQDSIATIKSDATRF